MSVASAVALGFVVASFGYWVVAALCCRRLLRGGRARPAAPAPTPPVSILKPVKGTDFEGWDNFVSHCEQDYPDFEVVFGAADVDDPATALIRRLQDRYGRERVRMVVAEASGRNPKAALLHELARTARHDVLVATDSDVRLPRDFLRLAVQRLAEPEVGLVTFPYRGDRAVTVAAAMEALGIETAFLPAVAVGRRVLRAPFALGAANALRRDALARSGGFLAVADYLADDYHLGERIGASGLRVEIGDVLVATVIGETSLRAWWLRQVRWARTIRASRPAHYPGLILTFTTPLAVLAALAQPAAWLWAPAAGSVCMRWLIAWKITGWTRHPSLRRRLWLLPICDLVAVPIWLAGLVGRTVRWRGRTFRFGAGGRLCAPARAARPRRAGSAPIRRIAMLVDRNLRRRHGIFEFTSDRSCLLRVSVCRAERSIRLADGTRVHPGERIAALHLWNERLPARPGGSASIRWGFAFHRRMMRSLRLLADFVHRSPELADIRAVTAELLLDKSYPRARLEAVVGRWGFDVVSPAEAGRCGRLALLGQSLHARLLRHALVGGRLRNSGVSLAPLRLGISRGALMKRYLTAAPDRAPAGKRAPAAVKE